MNLEDMSKAQRSLLTYLETCAVDKRGLVDVRRLGEDDYWILATWNESGFVKSGRVASQDSEWLENAFAASVSLWCELSDEAWTLAHQERKARSARMYAKREWKRTEEL